MMYVINDIPLATSSSPTPIPICGCEANLIADHLGISPPYMQNEARRWTEAAQIYSTLHHNHSQSKHSPRDEKRMPRRKSYSQCPTPVKGGSNSLRCFHRALSAERKNENLPDTHHHSMAISLNKVGSMNRSLAGMAGTGPHSRGDGTSLELEAIAAVHELSFAVQQISVSEILPRTPDLIFVNVTTVEGQPYCLELTMKGWRITSQRTDCMTGDFTNIDLFTKYYDSLYALMDDISPGYRVRFGEKLAHRLKLLQSGEEMDCMAPCGSYASPPLSISSSGSRHDSLHSSSDSLPVVTPVSSPTRDFDKVIFA